jgi:WD40 repeat protein
VYQRHEGLLNRVVMHTDGSIALTTGSDGTVRQWNLADVKEKSKIVLKASTYFGLAMSSDCEIGAAADGYGRIDVFGITRPNDSSRITIGADLNSSEKRIVRRTAPPSREVGSRSAIAFAAGDNELVSASNDKLRRWDLRTRACLAQCQLKFRHSIGIAVSAVGNRIVAAAASEGLGVWFGSNDETVKILKESIDPNAPISLTRDGRFAFTGTLRATITKWDLDEGRRIAIFEGHSAPVRAVAVTSDGRFCVTGDARGVVRLWAAETGQCLAMLKGHRGWVNGLAVTPDARRVASVGSDGTLRVWDIPEWILIRADALRKRGYMNAKVVLLGDSGVGKTGLALRLWHDRWKRTESTHGMEIQRLVLRQAGTEQAVEREVWLWDLAGQPDYRLTHQLFMEQTSLALFVFDPQELDIFATVGYWQCALRKVAHADSIVGILVAARCDRPGLRLTMNEVHAWAVGRGLHGPILTAAKLKRHPGAAELCALITKLLPWETMEFRSTMENFPALKDAILAVRDAKSAYVVTPSELESRVRKAAPSLTFTAEDLRAVTGLLVGEGVLHALPYGDLVVLQPSWVNSYASTLVKLAGEAENQLGHVPLATVQPGQLPNDGTPRLTAADERQLLPALVALFLKRALAWKQNTDKGEMLVFPNYVRLPRPTPPPRPGHTVLYRFTGPLEEIYCTLVVRLHYGGLFAKLRLYRQAVDFETPSGRLAALTMREQGERGELEIYFGAGLDADVQASFQSFVHDHLKAKATGLERLRNFVCPKCKEEVEDRKAIDNALSKGRGKIVCNRCDPNDPGMIDLNDVLERQFVSKAGEAGADEAARKANEQITSASKEGVMVGEVQAIVFSADQIYRTVAEPDEGVDGEIEFRNARKKATGLTYRVQLKSGDSHLERLKDGIEKFALKEHYEDLWAGEGKVPLLLIIRTSDGRVRYTDASVAIRAAQKMGPGKPVRRIVFEGKDFTKEAVLRLRDERLK